MNCSEVKAKMQLFLDEELLYQEMADMQKHLSLCAECESRFESEKMFKTTLRDKITRRPMAAQMVDDMKLFIMNSTF